MAGVQEGVYSVIAGFIVFIIGMSLSGTVAATASSTNSSLASYTTAQTMNNLLPLIYEIGLVVVGTGLMIFGGLRIAGKV